MKQAKNSSRYIAVLLILVMLTQKMAAQNDSITKVFVIRHAEKAATGEQDPSLSEIGKARAAAFAQLLSRVPITAIYSTPYRRTRETVNSLSVQKGIPVKSYDPMDTKSIQLLLQENNGKNVVFVGHSNTVPLLLNMLSQSSSYKNLSENDFGNIWILSLKNGRLTDSLHLTY